MPIAKRDPDFLKTLERMYHDSKLLFEEGENTTIVVICVDMSWNVP